ncbi:uncharacterized protein SPAPADRAFT_135571 [Spathaspora passalidarum NRRL Y-27907]|uniref:DUF2470 domain-containing protein n=1 Tax=Spathaspora passalidarum (strain NRRL Y-27907 / 11-Y1) TaxID=619300 RepID=G3AHC1_SPAPN|nr:uncharacterized protein SPAPADRAFT_135571 [Spathaspora passalidarum NRRL Y-27907]EGW34085.1 hypothetical protein SPAPADRAFT_135571 [Spathaspora passalidarum NRRL Y-27907]
MSSERIISHMNADHQLALIDYLAVYAEVKPDNLLEKSVKIVKVDDKQLVIEYNLKSEETSKSFAIYWDDALEDEHVPVEQMKDIKAKLIAMAKYCAKEQGFAVKKLTKVTPPTLASGPTFFLWVVLFLNIFNPNLLRSLPLLKSVVELPYYKKFEVYSLKIALGLFAIHVGEITFFTRNYLKKYRTPLKQRLAWYGLQMFEGFHVIQRLVAETK